MKADRAALAAALVRLDPALRLLLLHGPDEAASADMARRVAAQFASPDDPLAVTEIAGADLKGDPGVLLAAASAVSMFGDRTLVRVTGAGDEAAPAVAALLGAAAAGNPVVLVAGALRKGSALLTLAEASPLALAHASYMPEARDAGAVVEALAQEQDLRLGRGVARALFDALGGDRGLIRQELVKLALYKDAPGAVVEAADLAVVGSGSGDADISTLVEAVAAGRPAAARDQLDRLAESGPPGIMLLRGLARRLFLLLDLRQQVEAGASPAHAVDNARPPVFWKEKAAVTAQVERWTSAALRAALAATLEAERTIKRPASPGDIVARQVLLDLSRG